MMIEDLYASLAQMLDYPHDKESLSSALGVVREYLRDERLECSLTLFGGFVAGHTLAEIQEEYVATFDFNPTVAPYLGHHLFGDNQKKGTYLITLKGEYGRHGYIPLGNELPDHLPLILRFLVFLTRGGEAETRISFIGLHVLPGVEKLSDSFAASRPDSPWRSAVEAVRLICSEDSVRGARPTEPIGDGVLENSGQRMAHPEVRSC